MNRRDRIKNWITARPAALRVAVVLWVLISPVLILAAAATVLYEELWPEILDVYKDAGKALRNGRID